MWGQKASEEGTDLPLAWEQRRARVSLPPVPHLNVQITGLQQEVAALKVGDHHCLSVGFTWPRKASGKQAVATPS